jgi:hypothetical protein
MAFCPKGRIIWGNMYVPAWSLPGNGYMNHIRGNQQWGILLTCPCYSYLQLEFLSVISPAIVQYLHNSSSRWQQYQWSKQTHISSLDSLLFCLPLGAKLCGLVLRASGYISRGPEFDSRRYQIFWEVVGLERGPLSLVSITVELLQWKSSGSGYRKSRLTAVGIRCADHATPSIRKSWH